MPIHPTAVVDPKAQVDASADIGPYVVIEGEVRIGPGTRIYPHAYLAGWTEIGANCAIHPYAVIGHLPQDLAFKGWRSYCRIGNGTIIREGASVHRGTQEESETVIGRRCFLMANSHVAHNCHLGDDVKMANYAALAGHVTVGDGAFVSADVGVHQFVRIGQLVMISAHARVPMDIPPYLTAVEDGKCVGLNVVGLRRAGIGPAQRTELKHAFRVLYRSGCSFAEALSRLEAETSGPPARRFLEFLRQPSKRGIAGVVRSRRHESDPAEPAPEVE